MISNIVLKELNLIDGWHYSAKNSCIEKIFNFKGFNSAIIFVNAVAFIANKINHHPEVHISFNKVIISCQTHDSGSTSNSLPGKITDLDLKIAKEINNILTI